VLALRELGRRHERWRAQLDTERVGLHAEDVEPDCEQTLQLQDPVGGQPERDDLVLSDGDERRDPVPLQVLAGSPRVQRDVEERPDRGELRTGQRAVAGVPVGISSEEE
jgi:hypothetical protein